MKYKLVLMSDFHFSCESISQIEKKKDAIFRCIESHCKSETIKLIFIIIGDIANKGYTEEYDMAKMFFDSLADKIPSDVLYDFIFVPGNHDFCDKLLDSNDRDERKVILGKDYYVFEEFMKKKSCFTKPFNNFYDFKNNYTNRNLRNSNHCFDVYHYTNNGHALKIVAFNSSLLFDLQESKVKLIIDEVFVNDNLSIDKNDINIFLSHHPISWFNHNKKSYYNILSKDCDILVCGHEHSSGLNNVSGIDCNYNNIKLPAISSTNEEINSGFFILEIDPETTIYDTYECLYNGTIYLEVNKMGEQRINNSYCPNTALIPINIEKYNKFLNHKLLPFQNKKLTSFDEVFVNPTISITQATDTSIEEEYINFSDFNYKDHHKICVFLGDSCSGKTFLLKKIFTYYFKNGFIPIYVEIKDKKSVLNKIKKSASDFYGQFNLDYINQNRNKVVLLLDNAHFFKENYTPNLNELINLGYEKIYVSFNSELTDFEKYVEINEDSISYSLKNFGHLQKYEIIEKWVKVEKNLTENQVNNKIHSIKSLFEQSMVSNSINNPEVLWIFLDAYEENCTEKLISGSKCVYYDYLFSKYILEINKKQR